MTEKETEQQDDNLKLWQSVEKTDPNHTKKANVGGNKITAIAPQYQIMNATRVWGSYGTSWGFKTITHDYSLAEKFNLVGFHGLFYYPYGEFPITSSIKLYKDNALTKVDDDWAKKLETDTLTKALSKLGFNADVFMGRYDDVKYLNEVTKEFTKLVEQPTKDGIIILIDKAKESKDLSDIKGWIKHFDLLDMAKTKSKTF